MKKILPVLVTITVLLLGSCASMELTTISEDINTAYFEQFEDRSLSIEPVDVSLESSRAEFDVRGKTLTINGQTIELGDTYLERTDDMDLGAVGVVDTNIFKKAGINTDDLNSYIENALIELVGEDKDFFFPVNRSAVDIGSYSNRHVTYDFKTFPYTPSVEEGGESLGPIFKSVSVAKMNADFNLEITAAIRSEVFQILEDDEYIQSRVAFGERKPQKGDYYLSFMLLPEYKVINNKTGEVVFDKNTKLDSFLFHGFREQVYIPVESGNRDKYSKFFREFDFNSYAEEICDRLIEGILPGLRPMFQNMNKWVEVEEEEL